MFNADELRTYLLLRVVVGNDTIKIKDVFQTLHYCNDIADAMVCVVEIDPEKALLEVQ